MSTPIENNTAGLQEIVQQVNELHEGGAPGNAVLYTEQALTPEQQEQARQNIGASPVNIYTGPNEPTDENIQIWINPDEEPENVPSKTVQTDWDQTDDTAPDFLKNKPFGDDGLVIFPLSDAEFTFSEDDGGGVLMVESTVTLVEGDVLIIGLNNTTYTCTITSMMGMSLFGNLSAVGLDDTGEPFYGMVSEGVIVIIDISVQETTVKPVSISTVYTKKLDPKYNEAALSLYLLQDNNGVNRVGKNHFDPTALLTWPDISAAIANGRLFLIKADPFNVASYIRIEHVSNDATLEGYGVVYVMKPSLSNTQPVTIEAYYTAEYTPPTT